MVLMKLFIFWLCLLIAPLMIIAALFAFVQLDVQMLNPLYWAMEARVFTAIYVVVAAAITIPVLANNI